MTSHQTFDTQIIHTMKTITVLLAISLVTICSAMEDTQENRSIEADRYLKANPPSEHIEKMAIVIAEGIPKAYREGFISTMPKNVDMKALTKEVKEILIKTFTAGELKALADLYSSPEGKSAMGKLGKYIEAASTPLAIAVRNAERKTHEQPIGPPPNRNHE